MAGKTPQIGITNKAKYGEDYYVKLGQLGGKARVPKGFSLMDPEKRSQAGRKGGSAKRRPKL